MPSLRLTSFLLLSHSKLGNMSNSKSPHDLRNGWIENTSQRICESLSATPQTDEYPTIGFFFTLVLWSPIRIEESEFEREVDMSLLLWHIINLWVILQCILNQKLMVIPAN